MAGGFTGPGQYISSTERFTVGLSASWEEVRPLPRPLSDPRAVTLHNNIFLFGKTTTEQQFIRVLMSGGHDSSLTSREEIYRYEEEEGWVLVSRMWEGRCSHAVSVVTVDSNLLQHCH